MSQNRYYSSTAAKAQLQSSVSNSATNLSVDTVAGFPVSTPFTLILEQDTASEEIVTVTAVSGTTLTVTRGEDGSSAVAHSVGASVIHGVSARDYTEPQVHIGATSNVHGVTSAIVGTDETQTLHNKSLVSPAIDSFTNAQHDHSGAAGGGALAFGSPAALAVGAAQANGTAVVPARADHIHAMPAFGSPGNSAVGDASAAGTATTLARADHVHGREAFGSPVAVGAALADGTAATLARSDHVHSGGVLVCTSTTLPATPAAGMVVFETDTKHLLVYDGSAWQPYVNTNSGAWQTYTPTWTAQTTNPTLGNGTLLGRYRMIGAKTCFVAIELTVGSTTNVGSGIYSLSLPFSANGDAVTSVLAGFLSNSSGSARYPVAGDIAPGSSSVSRVIIQGVSVGMSDSSPFTPTTNTQLIMSGVYEIA